MSWQLVEEGFDPDQNLHWEGLCTLGSGPLHIRGSLEEQLADSPQDRDHLRVPGNVTVARFEETRAKWGCYLPGVYGAHPLLGHELINLPWAGGIDLRIEDERFDPTAVRFSQWRRILHLDRAELERSCTWHSPAGPVQLHWRRIVSAARPQLLAQQLQVTAERDCQLLITAGIDAAVRTSGYDHLTRITHAQTDGCLHMHVCTDRDEEVRIASKLQLPDGRIEQGDERRITETAIVKLQAGQERRIDRRSAWTCGEEDPCSHIRAVAHLAYDALLAEHLPEQPSCPLRRGVHGQFLLVRACLVADLAGHHDPVLEGLARHRDRGVLAPDRGGQVGDRRVFSGKGEGNLRQFAHIPGSDVHGQQPSSWRTRRAISRRSLAFSTGSPPGRRTSFGTAPSSGAEREPAVVWKRCRGPKRSSAAAEV
ncbi:MAG: hypothetical protein ACOCXJ_08315 [Planctomycetota bacterium]